ncbi:hypothetical protein H0H92_001991 [Tricholoma furcatifolium]|nr:hypothetical protein H0H92_001991 [Tricholoma furcatifolium]
MDNFFGWARANSLLCHHGINRPNYQARLLQFWDDIGCPWKPKKQEFGPSLKIIGFFVNINLGTLTLSDDSVDDIVQKTDAFIHTEDRRPPLRHWLRLAGHLNWLLNVLPWGRPALCELYRKTAGKDCMNARIFLNREVITDLTWLIDVIPSAIGVHSIDATHWPNSDADFSLWTDASAKLGMSFVYPGNGFMYELKPSPGCPTVDIFFLEMVAILSAIEHIASTFEHPPKRILLWSDSLDSISIFNSLRASESMHNAVLLAVSAIVIKTGIDLRVCHIPGKENIKADLLSRLMLNEYH